MAVKSASASAISDDDLLRLVGEERKLALGFDNDSDLIADREKALNYSKGEMPDVPALPNRSKAVSTDVMDAIETILPDLVEIFVGGDDVAVFIPNGPEDEDAAEQETDYVRHVMFNENDGFLAIYSMFKDALQLKTGIVKYWWEDSEPEEERLEGRDLMGVQMAAQDGEITEAAPSDAEDSPDGQPRYDITVKRPGKGKLRVMAVPPEDFAVAKDTVRLPEATYCAMRSRVRAQDLIAQGVDRAKVDELPAYGVLNDGAVATARDTALENSGMNEGSSGDHRIVEVVEHYVRVLEGKKLVLKRLLTGENEAVLLDKEDVDRIQFSAITPFIVTHRFYGQSVADRLLEIQRISTALTRMALDSGYFALNQRVEVADSGTNENTLPDLLRNEPGVPVRVKTVGTIKPISAGSANFDFFGALEFFQTKVEQRTGIVRAAQGLTPDTLHDTARGAMALLTQAQKRVRLIARIFAETGVKDLFLGVHALLRKHGDQQATVRLRNKWVQVAPTSWGQRSDMSIEIGLGASGKEQELANLQHEASIMQNIVTMQGGATGPLVTLDNVYNMTRRTLEKLGCKAPEKYISDPKEAPPQQPKPDPVMQAAQAKLQMEQAKAQGQQQLDQQKAASDAALAQNTAAQTLQLKREEMAQTLQLKQEQLQAEMNLKREQLQAELQLKRELAMMGGAPGPVSSDVHIGGAPG